MEHIVGTIVENATTTQLEGGKTVVNFRIVVTDKYYSQSVREWKERKRYFECRLWHKVGAGKYILKGQVMAISGLIDVRAYKNAAGDAVGKLIMDVDNFDWKGWAANPNKGAQQPVAETAAFTTGGAADDLPF